MFYFPNYSVKEFLSFAGKMVMQRIGSGVQAVDYEGKYTFSTIEHVNYNFCSLFQIMIIITSISYRLCPPLYSHSLSF